MCHTKIGYNLLIIAILCDNVLGSVQIVGFHIIKIMDLFWLLLLIFNGGKFLVLTFYFACVLLFDFEMLGKFVVF